MGAGSAGYILALPANVPPPPIPADTPLSAARVELGRRLFYDADLSADGTMSCATCHEQKRAFADGNATRPGVTGEAGRRNVPGLANVAWFERLTAADPKVTTLEAQIAIPVFGIHPVEMGMAGREAEIGARLGKDRCYRRMFRKAFPQDDGRIDFTNVARAIAGFERTLISLASPYDRGALSPLASQGERLFKRDCAACHSGSLFTDMAYHRLEPFDPDALDKGLSETTGKDSDIGKFRTPSLRNVMLTGPWWHDGSARSIEEAIRRHRIAPGPDDTAALMAFLTSLSDQEFTRNPAFSLPDTACGKPL